MELSSARNEEGRRQEIKADNETKPHRSASVHRAKIVIARRQVAEELRSTGVFVGVVATPGGLQQRVSATRSEKQGHAVLEIGAGFGMYHQPRAGLIAIKIVPMVWCEEEMIVQPAPIETDHRPSRVVPAVRIHSDKQS